MKRKKRFDYTEELALSNNPSRECSDKAESISNSAVALAQKASRENASLKRAIESLGCRVHVSTANDQHIADIEDLPADLSPRKTLPRYLRQAPVDSNDAPPPPHLRRIQFRMDEGIPDGIPKSQMGSRIQLIFNYDTLLTTMNSSSYEEGSPSAYNQYTVNSSINEGKIQFITVSFYCTDI
ncbi:hypothetical protein L2E82_50039 [Cichorium intybus]|nr:hypothetical protein L2E82_50039 [Cichorium intybus]